jgi:hypothetical protein
VYDSLGDEVASKEGYCVISKTTAYKHVDCQDTSPNLELRRPI